MNHAINTGTVPTGRITLSASALILTGLLSSPALAAELIPGTGTAIEVIPKGAAPAAPAMAKQTVMRAAQPFVSPARSGLLFSLGRSELADIDVVSAVTGLGYTGVSGGELEAEIGAGLGYRQSLGHRFSLDAQYLLQSTSARTLQVTVPAGTEAAAAQAISNTLPKLAQGISLTGLYHLPFTPQVSAHLGGGAFIWRGERETRIGPFSATDKTSGTDPVLQLGLGYKASQNVSVEANVHRFLMDEPVNRVSLGLVYRF